MKKLTTSSPIYISIKNGVKSYSINGKRIEAYGLSGASCLASEAETVQINDASNIIPLHIEFNGEFTSKIKTKKLENIVAEFEVTDLNRVAGFITVTDPNDISDISSHEQYQETLETVVKEDEDVKLYKPVRRKLSKTERKMLEKQKEALKDASCKFDFSEVGFVQFFINIEAESFYEVFMVLNRVISRLDKKTRALLKKQQ